MPAPMQATAPIDAAFDPLAEQLHQQGYAVATALAEPWLFGLLESLHALDAAEFSPAAIGRELDRTRNAFVRRDDIHWIEGTQPATDQFLSWMESLRLAINRRLFLGLFEYECHFALYPIGGFYRTHLDAFRGESNRILSTVLYLNPGWASSDGGELVLYQPDRLTVVETIAPCLGTMVMFLSEEFPHEVRPAARARYSVAGWYRLNASTADRVDPAR